MIVMMQTVATILTMSIKLSPDVLQYDIQDDCDDANSKDDECRKAHLFALYDTIKTRSKNPCLIKNCYSFRTFWFSLQAQNKS